MPLNTAVFGGYTQTERSKLRKEITAYFNDNPDQADNIPEAWMQAFNDDTDDYLKASAEERREDWTGRPSRVDYLADALIGQGKGNPEVAQYISQLPDIGQVAVGEQTPDTKVYHGPTSLLGKIGMGVAIAGAVVGATLGGAALASSAGIGSGFGGLATGGGGAAAGGGGAAVGVGAGGSALNVLGPGVAEALGSATIGAGTAGSGLSVLGPGVAEAMGSATIGTGAGAGSGLLAAETARNTLSPLALEAMGSTGIGSTSAITGAGAGAGNMGMAAFEAGTGITTPAANLNAYGALTEAAGGIALPSGANLGMAGYNNVMGTLGAPVYGPSGPGVGGTETMAPVVEKSVQAGTGWAAGQPALGPGLLAGLTAGDILTVGTLLADVIDGDGGGSGTTGEPFQFTPFNSTPVNAPETQRVFPQGGYYQQQANAMVPGGGQQMPTPEQYQGLLNSAFSRREQK